MKNKIYILQDCDVDGLVSSVLAYKYLVHLNVPKDNVVVLYHEDKRHGLNDDIMGQIKDDCALLWIPDANASKSKYVEKLNCKIIQTDHHAIAPLDGVISINNQYSPKIQNKYLSGAGVTYKFIMFCCQKQNDKFYEELRDLVALSNIADVMDIRNIENRLYNYVGLSKINNPFLLYLINNLARGIATPTSFAWDIIPKLNATIRSSNMALKENIFNCFVDNQDNFEEVTKEIKKERNNQNKTVQKLLKDCTIEEYNKVVIGKLEESSVYTGLIANKIMSKYNKPTLCIHENEKGFMGSCRSPVDVKDQYNNSDLLYFAEGHPASFGISIPKDNFDDFLNYIERSVVIEEPCLEICSRYTKNNIPSRLFGYWDKYSTLWGNGLNNPVFYIVDIQISSKSIQVLGRNQTTLKFEINDVEYIMFFATKELKKELHVGENVALNISVIGKLGINEWNGNKKKQVIIDKIEVEVYNKEKTWEDLF